MLDPAAVWETVLGDIIFGHLLKTGKGTSLYHRDKKLCCKQAATATEFPTCRSKADVELEVDMYPAAASASPGFRDSLCQNPCAALGSEFVQRGWAGERGHLLSDKQPLLPGNAPGCLSQCPTISSFP